MKTIPIQFIATLAPVVRAVFFTTFTTLVLIFLVTSTRVHAGYAGANGGTTVPLGGGAGAPPPMGPVRPPNVNAPIPQASVDELKKHDPFKGKTDAQIRQKVRDLRQNILNIIDALKVDNPKVADCIKKAFDRNRICIDPTRPDAAASIDADGLPTCGTEAINIGVATVPCSTKLYDIGVVRLMMGLAHEGEHALQDFRVNLPAGTPADIANARALQQFHANEEAASNEDVRRACDLINLINANMNRIRNGQPVPPNSPKLAKKVVDSILNDPNLTPAQRQQAATDLRNGLITSKAFWQQTARCRAAHKRAYKLFADGVITKDMLNDFLKITGWFKMYGSQTGFGPFQFAYLGDGESRTLRQIGPESDVTFGLPGLDHVCDMILLDEGTKMIIAGGETESGDGVVIAYSDTNGDGFFEEGTYREVVRTNDLFGGVHLAINPATGDILALNRTSNEILKLVDSDDDGFPDFTDYAGAFEFGREDIFSIIVSEDGTTVFGTPIMDPSDNWVARPGVEFSLAVAVKAGAEFIPMGRVNFIETASYVPAFDKIPLAGETKVRAHGTVSNAIQVFVVFKGKEIYIGEGETDAQGFAAIQVDHKFSPGELIRLVDPANSLHSVDQIVGNVPGEGVVLVPNALGLIEVIWAGEGTLEFTPDLATPWAAVAGARNPMTVLPGATGFYRLKNEEE